VISVLCPTRNRPDNVRRLLASGRGTATGPVQYVFYCDSDALLPADVAMAPDVITVAGPRIVLSDMWNKCAEHAEGDVFMQCGDDIIFRTPAWDATVYSVLARYPDKIVFVYGRDGLHAPDFGTHGFVHRRWYETLGYFTPPYFSSDYGDTWLNDLAKRVGRHVHVTEILTEHMHPVAGKADWDQTHQERLARRTRDNVASIWARTTPEREADARKLQAAIEEFAG
jgi:hypothetical protein